MSDDKTLSVIQGGIPEKRPGREVVIGPRKLTVPPLLQPQVETLQDDIGKFLGASAPVLFIMWKQENTDAFVKVVLEAIRPNHPDVTADDIKPYLTGGLFAILLAALNA